ncbi:hypothetical protein GGI04_000027 [Coemansia thaxteri]|uniref:PABS domain-containing protein n=1 Tax=Coemansia thaxteri TaxID=2663907 RepID=A0A9W8BB22_9FUNG|nr:hypothetical protein H4R26_004401 [Coemansia thaxteri]KAJ2009928.1 hypothetical protein GGI04_000027 [Coemansia thaxteri]KAJ2474286.1 hypothetical protein GGI02_000179 [Coemansia sp. RSA 2322]KAJ2480033.1 hypothetical protein EV174_003850 [Coemansia sp. RSA 2320]
MSLGKRHIKAKAKAKDKDMAASKAKDVAASKDGASADAPGSGRSPPRHPPRQRPAAAGWAAIAIGFVATSVMLASVVRLGPQYLEAVYGNVLSQQWFAHGMAGSVAAGAGLGWAFWRRGAGGGAAGDARVARGVAAGLDAAALLTALAPWRTAQLFRASRWLGPAWGPVVTHVSLAGPAGAACGFVAAVSAARVARSSRAAAAAYVGALAAAAAAWDGRLAGDALGGCGGLLAVAGVAAAGSLAVRALGGCAAWRAAAVAAGVAVGVGVATLATDPRCARGVTARNNSDAAYHMLARGESATGWVSVSDEAARGLRVLRSGHSIIGGHWNATRESIFGVFYYADAVRLVLAPPRAQERALVIGLGIGVAARSLHERGVRVDVVELDAAVYDAAVRFFALPRALNAVFLQDARRFIDAAPPAAYDYVVHDVFTGGSVPPALFSLSAVEHLRRILAPHGVLAMNYVGVLGDRRTLLHVAHTLRAAFAHVRCFAESTDDPDAATNMMFFASPDPIAFAPGALRAAADPESIRGVVLAAMEANEVSLAYDGPPLRPITDAWNPLPRWLAPAAVAHWHAMRGMFPDSYWLNY